MYLTLSDLLSFCLLLLCSKQTKKNEKETKRETRLCSALFDVVLCASRFTTAGTSTTANITTTTTC
jgi:hypothetical protein